jgi:hypothetical protein
VGKTAFAFALFIFLVCASTRSAQSDCLADPAAPVAAQTPALKALNLRLYCIANAEYQWREKVDAYICRNIPDSLCDLPGKGSCECTRLAPHQTDQPEAFSDQHEFSCIRLPDAPTPSKKLLAKGYRLGNLEFQNYYKHLEELTEYEQIKDWAPWDDRLYTIRKTATTLDSPPFVITPPTDNLFSVDFHF